MPVYEYICNDCRKVSSIFTRSISAVVDPVCAHCRGKDLQRKISRVVIAKGTRRAVDDLDRRRLIGHYEGRDKGSRAAWARRMANELGEAGADFRQMAEKVEAGEDVWDLYDPAPVLDHKLNSTREAGGGEASSGGGSADEGHSH
jgi:putative FmdB family regulatory protein